MSFKDHFSEGSSAYALHRPRYPAALFEFLGTCAPARETAWDCATGNGQAAVALAQWFDRVIATDASREQIEQAEPHSRVEYRIATAEASGIDAGTIDLVTVAQAVHWFEFDAFYDEVRRVLRPGGALAVWGYGLMKIAPEIDAVVDRLYGETLATHWLPERSYIEEGYRTLPFPLADVETPPFEMLAEWRLNDVLGYLGTWSAVRRYEARHGVNPMEETEPKLAKAWGSPDATRTVRWPLAVRVGRCE